MKKNKAVKKNSAQSKDYLQKLESKRKADTITTIAYVQQEMLDTAALTLAEEFGFGEERQKRFYDAFDKKYCEVKDLEKDDTEDGEYYKSKVESALKQALGKYYQPRSERYSISIRNQKGEVVLEVKGLD